MSTPEPSSGVQTSGAPCVLAGLFAGCVTRSCTSPLDVVKILCQLSPPSSRRAGASYILHLCRELYSVEGFRGFWKGNLAGCCRLGPYAGVKFYIFDTLANEFPSTTGSHSQRALFGGIAGTVATVVAYPMEVVRTHLILQKGTERECQGILHGLHLLVKAEGVRGLYCGLTPGVVGSIPFEGTQFACFEGVKAYAMKHRWPAWRWDPQKEALDSIDYLVIGSMAGATAQIVSYPFDTIKKRLQAQILSRGRCLKKYKGMTDCAVRIIKEEGVLALYRGSLPNLLRVAPFTAIMFTTYEFAKHLLLSSDPASLMKRYDERTHRHIE
ncbi:Hydrogenosomal carrier protein [Aphanomyces cochlioides]|nr:Hydrogenosomal carrier protein [Aphanomyces cochlioides]